MTADGITNADIAAIRKALAQCDDCAATINRMKTCGIDCQEQEADLQMAQTFLQKLIQVYGPQFPTKSS